jgi:hypothetical protein
VSNPGTHKPGDSNLKGNKPMNDALRKRAARPSRLPAKAANEKNQWLLDLGRSRAPDKG